MNKPNTSSNGALIHIAELEKEYFQDSGEGIPVLKKVSLDVYPGEMVAVMGPSGSGKSTLLFILGLFLSPSRGIYNFAGENVLALNRHGQAEFRRERIGFVFQSTDLLENTTVYENLEFPMIYAEIKRRDRPTRIHKALEMVNLGHRIHHPTNRLSGGEKQRVNVARAMVNSPEVILADEPTGQLDKDNSKLVMDHFVGIAGQGETSVVMVTHDPNVGDRCDRVYMMEDGLLWEKKKDEPSLG